MKTENPNNIAVKKLQRETALERARCAPGFLFRRVHQITNAKYTAAFREYDITGVQFITLVAVWGEAGISSSGVAERISYDKATTGQVLKRLVEKGLLARRIGPIDRREKVYTVTTEGKAALTHALTVLDSVAHDVLSPLDESEQETLVNLLVRLEVADSER